MSPPEDTPKNTTVTDITGYHAHIYYDETTKATMEDVRRAIAAQFPEFVLGTRHDDPVGPHPTGSFLFEFPPDRFADVVPWMALNRQGLVALVHPETGHALKDHTVHALWMGAVLELNEAVLVAADAK